MANCKKQRLVTHVEQMLMIQPTNRAEPLSQSLKANLKSVTVKSDIFWILDFGLFGLLVHCIMNMSWELARCR